MSLFFLLVATFFFALVVLFSTLSIWNFGQHSRRTALISSLVALIAGIAYLVMSRGWFTHVGTEEAFLFPRYVEWLFSTPLIVFGLARQARATVTVTVSLVVFDILMVATGFIAALAPFGLLRVTFLCISVVGFALLIGILVHELALAEITAPPRTRPTFSEIIILTIVVWCGYPLVWVLSAHVAGVIPDVTQNYAYAILDLCAKGVLSLLLVRQSIMIDKEFSRAIAIAR